MNSRQHIRVAVSWILALAIPMLVAWVWMSSTLTQACATGGGGWGSWSSPGRAGLVLLVCAGPIAIGWLTWRASASWARTVVAVIASALIAGPLILLTLDVCWVVNGCYD